MVRAAFKPAVGALRGHEWLVSALLAALTAAILVAVGPAGGDVPAHLYRTLLVRNDVYLWDNLWFAGHYPLVSYSLLYYPVASVTQNAPLVVAAAVASGALFQRIAAREWGPAAGIWPARAFAVLAAAPLLTGTYAYAVGVALLLAAVAAAQSDRAGLAVVFGALTLGFSPLAFVFLLLVLAAAVVARRRIDRRTVAVGIGLAAAAGVQLAALHFYPSHGEYPFRAIELATVCATAAVGAYVASRAERGDVLVALFALWVLASVVLFVVPDPVGENVSRLRSVAFPLMLLAVVIAPPQPRWLIAAALAGALAYSVVPYGPAVASRLDARGSQEGFWAPALSYLRAHSAPGERVEVVPTADHWESYWVPRAGFPLARGWYRQLDIAQNDVFYRDTLSPAAYLEWLRRMAIRHVLLPDLTIGKKGADREARLLRAGLPGLRLVLRTPGWRIYELEDPAPILSGPGEATLTAFTHDRIAGRAGAAGSYRLAVRYMRYWEVAEGAVCLSPAPGGMTRLEVRRPGNFLLTTDQGALSLVRAPLRSRDGLCR